MASFQAKISWERPKKRRKKKSFWWLPTQPVIENSKKIYKRFAKLKNTIMASLLAKISWERLIKGENKKKKKSVQWVPARPVIENSKKIAKKFTKLKKYHFGFSSGQNKFGMAEKERK